MKKLAISLLVLFTGCIALAQSASPSTSIHELIQQETDKIYDSLVNMRRDFYMNPEISEQEIRTSGIIASYLRSLGLEVKTNIGGYGVVGILKGENTGKHIAWRADIDALPSDIPDPAEFKSKNKGVRHICGHDVHTTIALGMATVLSKHKVQINGTIYFVFQPAEEIMNKGAETMISDGLFEMIDPTEIYALHITPLPTGLITSKEKELYSYFRNLKIRFKISTDKDATVTFIKELMKTYNTVPVEFWDGRNVIHPQLGIGSPQSMYLEYLAVSDFFNVQTNKNFLELSIGVFGTNIHEIDSLVTKVKTEISNSKFSAALTAVFFEKNHPTVNNNPKLTAESLETISSIYGEKAVIPTYGVINGFNDDFSYFQQKIPGVYFLFGASNFEKGIISMPHSPTFSIDEEAIRVGVKYFSSMLFERLHSEKNSKL